MFEKSEKKKKTSSRVQVYLGISVSALCTWWIFYSIEEDKLFKELASVNFYYLTSAFLLTIVSYVLRSLRWPGFFSKNIPSNSDAIACVFVGFFMNNILPARIGEFIRAHMGGKLTRQSRSTVLATIASERILDGLVISLLFAVLFSLSASQKELEQGGEFFAISWMFLFISLSVAVVVGFRNKIFSLLKNLQTKRENGISNYALVRAESFMEGLEPLANPFRLIILFLISLVIWSVELAVYDQIMIAFGQTPTLASVSLFLAAVNFSSLIPAAPGGIGVIEAFSSLALSRIGIEHETALAMVLCQHIIQYIVVGVPGSIFFFTKLKGKIPEGDIEDETLSDTVRESSEENKLESSNYLSQASIDLSIVIPAYNESRRISPTITSTVAYLRTRATNSNGGTFEIIVVDDGSTDNTPEVIGELSSQFPEVRYLGYAQNRGKGYAVRFGVKNSRGNLILYTDADGAAPIAEIERLVEAIALGADVVIGSRALFSLTTKVEALLHRKFMGRIFNGLVNLILVPYIADTQCGFKLFTRKAAAEVFSRQQTEGFSFDVEILFISKLLNLRVVEVPINWTNIAGSKVNLVSDSLKMLKEVIAIRIKAIFGKYSSYYA